MTAIYRLPNTDRREAVAPFVGHRCRIVTQPTRGTRITYVGTIIAVSKITAGTFPWAITITAAARLDEGHNQASAHQVPVVNLTISTAQLVSIEELA